MKFLITAIAFSLVLGGCSSTTTGHYQCPGFDDTYFALWFPYQEGQVINFKNMATGEVFNDAVDSIYHTAPYETTSTIVSAATCASTANVKADSLGVYYNFAYYPPDTELKNHNLNVSVGQTSMSAGRISAENIEQDPDNPVEVEMLDDFQFEAGGLVYDRVALLKADTVQQPYIKISRIWVARNHGIVGYAKRDTHQTWIKQ